MKRSNTGSRQLLWYASGAVVLCTAVGATLFLNAYASLSRTAFRDRTATYARAFAATVDSWLARSQVDVAQTLADVLVTGSVRGVEIISADGRPIVSAGDVEGAATSPRGRDAAFETALPSSGGTVRMQVDDSSTVLAVRHAAYLSVGGALMFDAAMVAILAWALRGRRRQVASVAPGAVAAADGRTIVGELEILPARCEASYAGAPLRLTPKQFALLSVLASEPGRVFTEAQILAAAWPDSPYADSRDIKQYIYLLRRRMAEIQPDGRDVIVTVPGFGYRLDDGH